MNCMRNIVLSSLLLLAVFAAEAATIHTITLPADIKMACPFVPGDWEPFDVTGNGRTLTIWASATNGGYQDSITIYVLSDGDEIPEMAIPIGSVKGRAVFWIRESCSYGGRR